MKNPEIALIGGASGTGKTTTSRLFTGKYGFHHSIGTGFIREICKNYISKKDNIYLHTFSFDASLDKRGFDLLIEQSKDLIAPINKCIDRARREGTKLVIEGVNILPQFFDELNPDIKIILKNDDPNRHINMCISESHSRRKVTSDNFENSRIIQSKLIDEAMRFNWKVIESNQVDNYLGSIINNNL
tara:strand:- start:270 stop:830 length:561 start_codon:yes stop_codon:yes gene_type:complete